MDKCKYCQAELEEGSLICPSCGADNGQPDAQSPQTTLPTQEKEPEVETGRMQRLPLMKPLRKPLRNLLRKKRRKPLRNRRSK